MLPKEYIINVYCLVDEMLKKVVKNSIHQRGCGTILKMTVRKRLSVP